MNRITRRVVKLAVEYSLHRDTEDTAWENRNKTGMLEYRRAVKAADVAYEVFAGACGVVGLEPGEAYDYMRKFVGSPGVVLPNGNEIIWPAP